MFGLVKRKFSELFFRIKLEKWIQGLYIFWHCSRWLVVLEHWSQFRDTRTILTHSLTQTASKTIFYRISSVKYESYKWVIWGVNDNICSDLNLMNRCHAKCIDELVECLLECETDQCKTECRRNQGNCNNGIIITINKYFLFYYSSMSMWKRLLWWLRRLSKFCMHMQGNTKTCWIKVLL